MVILRRPRHNAEARRRFSRTGAPGTLCERSLLSTFVIDDIKSNRR